MPMFEIACVAYSLPHRHIGKWGLGTFEDGASPLDKGFEYYYGQLSQMYCPCVITFCHNVCGGT